MIIRQNECGDPCFCGTEITPKQFREGTIGLKSPPDGIKTLRNKGDAEDWTDWKYLIVQGFSVRIFQHHFRSNKQTTTPHCYLVWQRQQPINLVVEIYKNQAEGHATFAP